ncbi:hypothetical protein BDN70DRAFT_719668 [Pholiota conissans]|uniref:Uncharacterized protein n=1 Tax=Pholiota conissans TaxID=109636 RepID=A0A9P5YJM1_9AGAR|nr:hypothetical protein BDN70DRAFT_719668 [Pholiota conissans]
MPDRLLRGLYDLGRVRVARSKERRDEGQTERERRARHWLSCPSSLPTSPVLPSVSLLASLSFVVVHPRSSSSSVPHSPCLVLRASSPPRLSLLDSLPRCSPPGSSSVLVVLGGLLVLVVGPRPLCVVIPGVSSVLVCRWSWCVVRSSYVRRVSVVRRCVSLCPSSASASSASSSVHRRPFVIIRASSSIRRCPLSIRPFSSVVLCRWSSFVISPRPSLYSLSVIRCPRRRPLYSPILRPSSSPSVHRPRPLFLSPAAAAVRCHPQSSSSPFPSPSQPW